MYMATEIGFGVLVLLMSSPILLALYQGPQSKKEFVFGLSILLSILGYCLVFCGALVLLLNPV
jgi:hypothetical protein